MQDTEFNILKIRSDVGEAMMNCLNAHKFNEISVDMIADHAGHSSAIVRRLFPDALQMVDQGLRDLDDHTLSIFSDDIAEDIEADIRERILEGLIVRFEAYTPFKNAIKNLNKASLLNPALASLTLYRLSSASRTILELSGDNTSGLKGLLRVKGLAGVALSAQQEWLNDDSPDMSATIRVLDQRLKQAEEIAETLKIIPAKLDNEN